mgnify:FL=1
MRLFALRLPLRAVLPTIGIAAFLGSAAVAQQGDGGAKPAAQSKANKAVAAKSQAAPGMKTCNYKFPDGERRTWACRKEEPCCAWDAIKYVKCGSTVTNCL